jgi:GNAT superfamily N-acetyltransferase
MRKSEVSLEGISSYGLYIYEREGKFIVEDSRGYATYVYWPDALYIEDMFVKPEFRKLGTGTELADAIYELARARGVRKVVTTVVAKAGGSTESIKAILAHGFKLDSTNNEFIFLTKNIGTEA